MAKITKTEFLDNIQGIINEGLNPNVKVDYTAKFNISRYVRNLFESGQSNARLMTYLNNYNTILNNGAKDFMLYEQFGQGLANFARGNREVKAVINEMNDTLANYGGELQAYRLIESIQDPMMKDTVSEAFENYLKDEDEYSRDILVDAIDALSSHGDPAGQQLLCVINDDMQSRLPQIDVANNLSRFDEIQQKVREDKQRKQMEEVKAQVDAYARQIFDQAEAEKRAEAEACTFESIVNNNGINLSESIKAIASSEAKTNKRLMETLEQYAGALNQGLYEERLYEGFVQNISKYNYLLPVAKELKRINESAKKNQASITVTKLLEEMSTTNSYYIIPLIEEDAARYVKNPSDINRVQLRNILCSFAGDPYCNAMLEAIEKGPSIETLDEKAISFKDQVKLVRQDANLSNIYSPVQYIKENECVFNANGQFYVKKGNTLAKLSNAYLNQLSESFISLCQLVNDPRVTINEDNIVLVGGDKVATIYEGYVDINGNRETTDTLRDLNEMAMKYDFDTNFFVMTSCLHEHFNDIAKINFGKHVALNLNEGVNIDLFKLGDNIFINTVNENIDKSTFYHNVNPIQCRNIINKHMGINVANLFEDLLPNQDKVLLKLNETKEEYEASIKKYEDMLEKLEKAKEECVSEDNEKKLDDAIEAAQKKVDELKKEYKDWQKDAEDATDGDAQAEKDSEEADNTDTEDTSEPIDAKDVDAAKPELMQPLNSEDADAVNTEGAEGFEDDEVVPEPEEEEDPEISDDEFDSYLEGGDELPADAEEIEDPQTEDLPDDAADDTEINMVHHALAGDGKENNEPDLATLDEPMDNEEDTIEDSDEPEVGDEDTLPEVGDEEDSAEGEGEFLDDELPSEEEPEALPEEPVEDSEEVFEEEPEEVNVPEGYQISNVVFDENVKTGKLFKTGSVTVSCPMVDEEGKMYVKSDEYHFYIDEETHLPICDAADIPVALYNAIVATIQEDENFERADSEGQPVENKDEKKDWFSKEEVDDASKELEQDDDDAFFDFKEDPEGDTLTITAKEEPEDLNIEEEPELPAEESEENSIKSYFDNIAGDEELPAEESEESEDPDLAGLFDDDDDEDDLPMPEEPEALPEPEEPEDLPEPEDEEPEKDFPDFDEVDIEDSDEAGEPEELDIDVKDSEGDEDSEEIILPEDSEESDDDIIEAPAEKIDIKESRRTTYSKAVNENRNKLVSLAAVVKKNGKDFFLSEGTIKPSKKEEAHVNEDLDSIDLSDEAPIEDSVIDSMHAMAEEAVAAYSQVKPEFSVSDLINQYGYTYFTIQDLTASTNEYSYTIYDGDGRIQYLPSDEFEAIFEDELSREVLTNNDRDYIDDTDEEGAEDLMNTLLLSFGIDLSFNESIKIKKPGLGTNGDVDKSKKVDDILHGDDEQRKFEKDVENDTQKAGVENPLAAQPQQQESLQLPNSHALIEQLVAGGAEIIYEPMDWVIIKELDMKAQVTNVVNDGDGKLTMLTVLASNGIQYDVDPKEIEPDPAYLDNIPGRVINSLNLEVPEKGEFDVDPKTRMTKKPVNEKPVVMKDFNK